MQWLEYVRGGGGVSVCFLGWEGNSIKWTPYGASLWCAEVTLYLRGQRKGRMRKRVLQRPAPGFMNFQPTGQNQSSPWLQAIRMLTWTSSLWKASNLPKGRSKWYIGTHPVSASASQSISSQISFYSQLNLIYTLGNEIAFVTNPGANFTLNYSEFKDGNHSALHDKHKTKQYTYCTHASNTNSYKT